MARVLHSALLVPYYGILYRQEADLLCRLGAYCAPAD